MSVFKRFGLIKVALTSIIFGLFVFYFAREFTNNLQAIRNSRFSLNWTYILMSFVPIVGAQLLVTYAWRDSLRDLSQKKLAWKDSIALLNIPALGKYIPGKLWSYAIQAYWLNKKSYSKTQVIYNNLLNVGVSLGVSALVGLVYVVYLAGASQGYWAWVALCFVFVADIFIIWQEHHLIMLFLTLINRFLKNPIPYFFTSKKTLIKLQFYYLGIFLLFGLGTWLLCFGIGFPQPLGSFLPVAVSYTVAEAIGFIVLIAPGGLGVRESVMYSILNQSNSKGLSLMLPIASRVVIMINEIILTLYSIVHLRRMRGLNEDGLSNKNTNLVEPFTTEGP